MLRTTVRDTMLIKPFESDNISDGGIIVPDSAKKRSNKATVIKVGNGIKDRPMRFKEGDIIFHVKDCGEEIIIDGEKYYFIKDNYVLAKL